MDDDYYATFNRENVTLVDIQRSPINGFGRRSLLTAEGGCELDALVLATGLNAITGDLQAIHIVGRGGRTLQDAWAEGARSCLGLAKAGFPNIFPILARSARRCWRTCRPPLCSMWTGSPTA
jgi:cation diffusion facilitator CzcD-associated flavoprotein CzcO